MVTEVSYTEKDLFYQALLLLYRKLDLNSDHLMVCLLYGMPCYSGHP